MADLHGRALSTAVWLWTVASFGTAFTLSLLAIVLPLRYGEKRLAQVHI
jgi:hypothetical protein